jgi:hypothetical protein
MDRGAIVGGVLISISLLLAVILNTSASREALPIGAANADLPASSARTPSESGAVGTRASSREARLDSRGANGPGIATRPDPPSPDLRVP